MSEDYGVAEFLAETETIHLAALGARAGMTKRLGRAYGRAAPGSAGQLFANFGRTVNNRVIDLFDDAVLLVDADRAASACILARCLMETHAVGMYALNEVTKAAEGDDFDRIGKKVLAFVNSSRIKVDEQKSLKGGEYSLNDYYFTDEARERMLAEAAQGVHVLNAMRYMFEVEIKLTGHQESGNELTYRGLSEWVHPSQTSLLHHYVEDAQGVETSIGKVCMKDSRRRLCVSALALIQNTPSVCSAIEEVSDILHRRQTGR